MSTGALSVTNSVNVALPVPPEFVAPKLTALCPSVVGVPEMTPVTVFTLNPAGNPLALKEDGLFVPVI